MNAVDPIQYALLNYRTIVAIRESESLTANQKLIMVMLASHGDTSFPSQAQLAIDTGLSVSTIVKVVAQLVELEAVEVVRTGRSSTYKIKTVAEPSVCNSDPQTGTDQIRTRVVTKEKGKRQEKNAEPKDGSWKDTHDAIIEHYRSCFERATGMTPDIDKREHKVAWELARKMTKEEAVDLIDAAFEDSWFVTNSRQLYAIANNVNKYKRPIRPQLPVFNSKEYAAEHSGGAPIPESALATLDKLFHPDDPTDESKH